MTLFNQGRLVTFTHRTTDVKIEVQGIKETEFKYFYHYIISFLFNSEKIVHSKGQPKEEVTIPSIKPGAKVNTLRLLKARDPEAFIFKKFGSDVVYSRICQKDHQPIPFSPDEVKMLPAEERGRAVKFWNYTTETDMYYLCRRGKFPYLNFITGQHPKNYCLACCKKTPAYTMTTGRPQNKKDRMYKSCIDTHEYVEQDEESGTSRYVMIYGKDLYVGRIGKLPDTIQQYLLYNLENVDILSEFTIARTFTMDKRKYSVDRLFKITKNIKVHKVPVIDLVTHLKNKSWEHKREGVADIAPIEVIDTPKKNRKFAKHHTRILNADMDYPILIYNTDSSTVVVDGLHRLSRAYMEKHPTIKVRYVTDKQLKKVLISDDNVDKAAENTIGVTKNPPVSTVRKNKKTRKTGGNPDEKKPGYYIYGVPQSNKNVTNIGVIYSLAVALNMNFSQFMTFTIKILKENPYYFNLLLNGELSRYFENNNALIETMGRIFRGSGTLITDFTRWNDLFVDIARVAYDKTVIIFDDTSIITTGTSMKVSVVDDINLILPHQVVYLEDIIPDDSHQEYILLLQRRKKSKSAFEKHAKVYYPIFIFVPYMFFKSQSIEKRVYTPGDEIMKLVKNMLKSALDERRAGVQTREHIDFRTISEFLEGGKYEIINMYLNTKDMCYAVVLKQGNESVYVPIAYSYFSGAERFLSKGKNLDDIINYDVFDRKGKFTASALKSFVEAYNKFVVKKSKDAGMLKTVIDEETFMSGEEAKVIPIYPFIKMTHFLALSDKAGERSGKKYSVIGLTDGELNYYISDISGTAIRNCHKTFATGYNMFTFNPKKLTDEQFHYLYYDPVDINKIVVAKEKHVVDQRQKILPVAFYEKYLYRLFTIELIRYFDKDRNDAIRKKVRKLVDTTNFKKVENYDKLRDQLSLTLEDFPNDLARIQEHVSIFYNTHFDKKRLIDDIKSSVYEFDRTTLVKVMSEGKDHWSLTPAEQIRQKTRMVDKLRAIAKNFVSIGKPKLDSTQTNILSACRDSNAAYCSGKKLVMSQKKFDDYTSLFADDLLNPMKSPYIMALIYSGNIIDEFQFERMPKEDIYIKF